VRRGFVNFDESVNFFPQVTQHQLLPNQSGTTTVLPLTITSRNTTTIPVNVSIPGLSGPGGGAPTINVVASTNLGGNILRSIASTTSSTAAASQGNMLPIAKVLPQQQTQVIGSAGDQQQNIAVHNIASVVSSGGGLWTGKWSHCCSIRSVLICGFLCSSFNEFNNSDHTGPSNWSINIDYGGHVGNIGGYNGANRYFDSLVQ
jgi:hypothetical protein